MNSNVQIISIISSFIFGTFFSLLTYINFKLIKNYKKIIQNILSCIFVLDMIIIYIILMYKINNGYFHIYFIVTVFIGFFVGLLLLKKYISKINVKLKFSN